VYAHLSRYLVRTIIFAQTCSLLVENCPLPAAPFQSEAARDRTHFQGESGYHRHSIINIAVMTISDAVNFETLKARHLDTLSQNRTCRAGYNNVTIYAPQLIHTCNFNEARQGVATSAVSRLCEKLVRNVWTINLICLVPFENMSKPT
jgi:hypothetical protein